MGLNPGELTVPVTIQQLTESKGSSGFPVETWTTLIDLAWMSREQQRGSERFAGAQLSAPLTTRWEMRYHEDMDPDRVDVVKKRRLVYQNRIFDIVAAEHLGQQDGIGLTTLAGTWVSGR